MEQKYSDSELIFRERDPSSSAFVILSGQVELLKKAPNGMVRNLFTRSLNRGFGAF